MQKNHQSEEFDTPTGEEEKMRVVEGPNRLRSGRGATEGRARCLAIRMA